MTPIIRGISRHGQCSILILIDTPFAHRGFKLELPPSTATISGTTFRMISALQSSICVRSTTYRRRIVITYSKICSRDSHALTLAHTERCQASSANFQGDIGGFKLECKAHDQDRISYRSKIIPTSRLTKRLSLVSLTPIYIGTQRVQNTLRLSGTPVPGLLTAMFLHFASL